MKPRKPGLQSPVPQTGGIDVVTTNTADMRETGFGSADTCQGIADFLREKHPVVRFNLVDSRGKLQEIVERRPDLVILCVKYIIDANSGDVVWLADFFERHRIKHSGSEYKTLDFDSNKSVAKTYLRNHGVATADFFLAHPDQYGVDSRLPLEFPLFVKPLDAANGNGIDDSSIVHDFIGLKTKIRSVVQEFGRVALVERVLPGREFTVAILNRGAHQKPRVMPVEIIAQPNENGDRILGARAKADNQEILQAVPEPDRSLIAEFALRAFKALGVRDFGRIDIKMDSHGLPHFLEANLVPGMTRDSSYFPEACRIDAGLSYEDVIQEMFDLSTKRKATPAVV